MLVCEAAGYDVVLVETVGVGQSEYAVASMVDFFLVLMLAGAGDELQGIKKGILELADALAINKADGDNVAARRSGPPPSTASALHLFRRAAPHWDPPVLTVSALEERGMDDGLGRRSAASHRARRLAASWPQAPRAAAGLALVDDRRRPQAPLPRAARRRSALLPEIEAARARGAAHADRRRAPAARAARRRTTAATRGARDATRARSRRTLTADAVR